MRRVTILAVLALALLPCTAAAGSVGIGAFGGLGIPIVQDDNGQGMLYGARVPVSVLPLLTVEPYLLMGSGGDKEQEIGGTTYTRTGLDMTGFGANLLFTFGGPVQFYPFAGIGSCKLTRDGSEDETGVAYNFGLGLGISPMPKLTVHLRGEAIAAVDGEVSRKWAGVTLGASYAVFSFPVP